MDRAFMKRWVLSYLFTHGFSKPFKYSGKNDITNEKKELNVVCEMIFRNGILIRDLDTGFKHFLTYVDIYLDKVKKGFIAERSARES